MELKTPSGRLREVGARRILELREQKLTYAQIARELDVSVATVCNVVRGRTWSWIEGASYV